MIACALAILLIARRGRATVPAALGILIVAALAGLTIGGARLTAIDSRALPLPDPGPVTLAGFVESEPGRSRGVIRFPIVTPRGRVMVEAADPGPGRIPSQGDGVVAAGRLGPPPDWYRPVTDRLGLRVMLRADRIGPSGARRTGITGLIDRMRERAEAGLARGMGSRESALARGFVLGQDAAIDDRTVEDFRRSGLAHLLAVSGQNIVLLGLLAVPVLALAGIGPDGRLAWIAGLIALYVPLAGGGASIQRAGAMGLAGLAAAAAGRAASRAWAVAVAAAATLALDPRVPADVGWQLSFAAVIGIMALAAPIRDRLAGILGDGGWQRSLADGAAVTVAASLATAPLIAFHFERLPVGTVAANLAALPAVAPAMWLGMAAAALGQVSATLALPLNLVNSMLLAYVARVASWFGRPAWATVELDLNGPIGLAAATGALVAALALAARLWPHPATAWTRRPGARAIPPALRPAAAALLTVALAWLVLAGPFDGARRDLPDPPPGGARVDLIDVGQGDAILIRAAGADPVLIDGGPPGGDLAGALDSAGVDRLAAVVLTHPDLDHFGGLLDLFGRFRADRLLFDAAPRTLLAAARRAGTTPARVARGDRLALGGDLTLELLWPPPREPAGPGTDPGAPAEAGEDANLRSVGALLRWRRFRMYLPGDGEAEAVPVDPGPLDVLKVAHHGSDDAGLPALLARSRPALAVIPVGAGNPFGHPTRETVAALAAAGARVLRTDRDGTVSIVLPRRGPARIETGR